MEQAASPDRSMRARWTALFAKHRAESRILLAFLAVASGGFLLVKAASEVMEGDTLAVDRALLLLLRHRGDPATPLGPPWLREAIVDLTALGSVTVLTVITALAAGYLVAARKPALAAFTVGAVAGGALLGNAAQNNVRAHPPGPWSNTSSARIRRAFRAATR
jgi:undecaprenyl-diphosphatase